MVTISYMTLLYKDVIKAQIKAFSEITAWRISENVKRGIHGG